MVVAIGKAQFWPDEDEIWSNVVKKPRPQWLDIFREWPPYIGKEEPKVSRGTIVISDDDEWLGANMQNAVPLLYVLGQPSDNWKTPAEAFQYGGFRATDKPHSRITFQTKYSLLIEHESSLQLFPPLELRSGLRQYSVDVADQKFEEFMRRLGGSAGAKVVNAELVRRFDQNPRERIVIACYHLFRAQFANEFMSPVAQDYSAYCASLEAAFDIDGTQRDVGANIRRRLVAMYPDLAALETWMNGLYAERSFFVHGASQEAEKKYEKDIAEFRKRPFNHDTLRRVCLDVIHETLRESLDQHGRDRTRVEGEVYSHLCKVFMSDERWCAMARLLRQKQSVETILSYSGQEKIDFLRECFRFANEHDWRYMTHNRNKNVVFSVLAAAAHIIVKAPDASEEDRAAATQLVHAAEAKDGEKVDSWITECLSWDLAEFGDELVPHMKAVAIHVARFFDPTFGNR